MTFFRYLISDKKSFVFSIILLLIILTGTIVSLIDRYNTYETELIDYIKSFSYLIIFLASYIGLYSKSYFNLRMQQRVKEVYHDTMEINSNIITPVEIFQDSFTIKAFYQNYYSKIDIKPSIDNYEIFLVQDQLFLLGQISDFGLFRRHLKPIMISLDNSKNDNLKYVLIPDIEYLDFIESGLTVKFRKSIYGIKKIIIKDFKKQTAPNKRS